ncbi:hypothetical protein DRQ33_05005 [bacterium]|mgnify:CR=1 FL=1|nr:MAG: hypothetical protein DRQ33_05005 [bacterium]
MRWLFVFVGMVLLVALAGAQDFDTLFFDDFESGDLSGWMPDLVEPQWHITSGSMAYDTNSWWSGNEEVVGGYKDMWLHLLVTPEIELPTAPTGDLTLTMMMDMSVETPPAIPETLSPTIIIDGWDGFNVRITTDGGTTWELLEPDGGYNCEAIYAFYYHGDTLHLSGWAGATDGWEEKTFDLSDYAGENVHIAFAFGSDYAYCTLDDPTLYGVLLDNIQVSDDADTYFSEDAEGDTTDMTLLDLSAPPMPVVTDVEAYEGTYSMFAQNVTYGIYYVTTPEFFIPDSFLATVSYYIYRDALDFEGDGDGYLDDYYLVYASTNNGISWERLIYDWYHEGSDPEWALCEYDRGYLATWEAGLTLYDYRGMNVRIKFVFRFDDNDDGGAGSGFYVDNFAVYGLVALNNDVGVTDIATSPINIDEEATISFGLYGYGIETAVSGLQYGIYDSTTDAEITSGSISMITVNFLETAYRSINWTPTEEGAYYILAWSNLATDQDRSNDTLRYDFRVDEDIYTLGYDDGVLDTFSVFVDTDTFGPYWVLWQNMGDTIDVYQDGISIMMNSHFEDENYAEKFMFYGFGTGDLVFKIFEFDEFGPVSMPTAEYEFSLPTDFPVSGMDAEWAVYELTEELELPDSFLLTICAANEESWVNVATDMDAGVEKTFLSAYDPTFGFYSHYPESVFYPRFDEVTAMMRCVTSGPVGIDEDEKFVMPTEPIISQNAPNPFNPATEISFQIPVDQNVRLEVVDIAGKVVRTLIDDKLPQGTHSVIWDGKNNLGDDMPSGIYLYRLRTDSNSITRKMTLIR